MFLPGNQPCASFFFSLGKTHYFAYSFGPYHCTSAALQALFLRIADGKGLLLWRWYVNGFLFLSG